MAARPVLKTALDLLDEAAILLQEAADIAAFSAAEREQVRSRLERMAGKVDSGERTPQTA